MARSAAYAQGIADVERMHAPESLGEGDRRSLRKSLRKARKKERRKGGFFRNGFEIAAMVVAFVFYWPLGLALLAYFAWRPDMSFLKSRAERALKDIAPGLAREAGGSTGNHAFDAYRAEVLERLEAERRKLEEDERAFADFLEELRRQKDREAFDRFMASRRNEPAA